MDGFWAGKRKPHTNVRLSRTVGGRLRTVNSGEDSDIGEVWAQQQRIRLAESVEEAARREARKQLRKERGLVGVAKSDISDLSSKVKTELFGKQHVPNQKLQHPPVPASSLAQFADPRVEELNRQIYAQRLSAKRKPSTSARLPWILSAVIVVVAGLAVLIIHVISHHDSNSKQAGQAAAQSQSSGNYHLDA